MSYTVLLGLSTFQWKVYCISSVYYFPAKKKKNWFADLWKNVLVYDIALFEK
jgi:hypothetical protein